MANADRIGAGMNCIICGTFLWHGSKHVGEKAVCADCAQEIYSQVLCDQESEPELLDELYAEVRECYIASHLYDHVFGVPA